MGLLGGMPVVTRGGLDGVEKGRKAAPLCNLSAAAPYLVSAQGSAADQLFSEPYAKNQSKYDHARPNQVKSTEINRFTDWSVRFSLQHCLNPMEISRIEGYHTETSHLGELHDRYAISSSSNYHGTIAVNTPLQCLASFH